MKAYHIGKRILSLVIVCFLAASLAACGNIMFIKVENGTKSEGAEKTSDTTLPGEAKKTDSKGDVVYLNDPIGESTTKTEEKTGKSADSSVTPDTPTVPDDSEDTFAPESTQGNEPSQGGNQTQGGSSTQGGNQTQGGSSTQGGNQTQGGSSTQGGSTSGGIETPDMPELPTDSDPEEDEETADESENQRFDGNSGEIRLPSVPV